MLKSSLFCIAILVASFNDVLQGRKQSVSTYKSLVKKLTAQSKCNKECLKNIVSDVTNVEEKLIDQMGSINDNERIKIEEIPQIPHETVDPITCASIPNELKFDCYPGEGATQASCEGRGCCWESQGSNKNYYEKFPRVPPSCFYPPNYAGYQFTGFNSTSFGITRTLARTTLSGYPEEIKSLQMDVYFETSSRIRIKIIDPEEDRWEPPLPAVPEVSTAATNTLYSFVTEDSRGGFAVIRNEDNQPLFDTRGAGQLVYANQYLQISSFLASRNLYGLGQHLEGLLLDTYWHRRLLWNYDQQIVPDSNLYGTHPFYLVMEESGNSHGVFLLNSNTVDIIIQPAPAITLRALGGVLDLYVFLGPTPSDVIQQYTEVIGRPFLPPYWSLGYHQCRYNYFSLNRTREVWEQTRNASIPFDVQWNDIDSLEEFRIFTYNQTFYAGLPEFVNELHSVEMKYIPIVDPGLGFESEVGIYPPVDEALQQEVVVMDENGNPYHGRAWPGDTVWPDFTNPEVINYWTGQFQKYQDLLKYDGAWLDMNEPPDFDMLTDQCNGSSSLNSPPYLPPVEGGFLSYRTMCMSSKQYIAEHYYAHNLYSITNCIATNSALKAVRERRPFIISRSTFPGLGSYAGHWTGDSVSTFGDMFASIADVLNFNLYGIPMVGADICGFNLNTTIPLCVKWYLLGAFYPFARNHNNEFCNPQDPVSLGEPVITVARNSLTERYRLLPYLYSLFFRAHKTGEPVARTLFYEFPEDKNTYVVDSVFMWGSGLLIAPALGNETFDVTVYFPKGLWYDWYSGILKYDSIGGYEDMVAPEDFPNLFRRGGTIIPHQKPGVTTAESRRGNFGLDVALDANQEATGELFWDDGDTLGTEHNEFQFSASYEGLTTGMLIGYSTPMILDNVRVAGLKKTVEQVTVGGNPANFSYSNEVLHINGFSQDLTNGLEISW